MVYATKCPHCSTLFLTKYDNKIYCSKKCRNNAGSVLARKKDPQRDIKYRARNIGDVRKRAREAYYRKSLKDDFAAKRMERERKLAAKKQIEKLIAPW